MIFFHPIPQTYIQDQALMIFFHPIPQTYIQDQALMIFFHPIPQTHMQDRALMMFSTRFLYAYLCLSLQSKLGLNRTRTNLNASFLSLLAFLNIFDTQRSLFQG